MQIVPIGRNPLEGRGLIAFGVALGVEGAFGVNAVGTVLLSGPAALRDHHTALGGQQLCPWSTGQFTSGLA